MGFFQGDVLLVGIGQVVGLEVWFFGVDIKGLGVLVQVGVVEMIVVFQRFVCQGQLRIDRQNIGRVLIILQRVRLRMRFWGSIW